MFTIVKTKMTYYEAELFCNKNGQRLANIVDTTISLNIRNLMKKESVKNAWFGLSDQSREGAFIKSDGSTLQVGEYTSWSADFGQGNKFGVEDCVTINAANGLWSTEVCSTKNNFVCENISANEVLKPLYEWTDWYSRDNQNGLGDSEDINSLRRKYPEVCSLPLKAECRVKSTLTPWNETNLNFSTPCGAKGLICLHGQQSNGKKCEDFEVRFFCPADIDECKLKLDTCSNDATCQNTHGSYVCKCANGFDGDGRYCFKGKTCSAHGDPHYSTFDGKLHNFMGTCTYRLAESCFNPALTTKQLQSFAVRSANEHRGNTRVSYTKRVEVDVYNWTIIFKKGGYIEVNGEAITPPKLINEASSTLSGSFISINKRVGQYEMYTDFGLKVSYDGISRVSVNVPSDYSRQMCGICGNYDGNAENDFLMPNGKLTNDRALYGSSWTAVGQNASCFNNVTHLVNECEGQNAIIVSDTCNVLKNAAGPFGICHGTVDPTPYFDSCYIDGCSNSTDSTITCAAIDVYAKSCALKKINIDWKTSTPKCEPKCGVNEVYSSSATACENSCADLRAEEKCALEDTEGCVCQTGFVRSGFQCVPVSECGCVNGNAYAKIGDVWYSDNCQTMHTCVATDTITVDNKVSCHKKGSCVRLPDNTDTCICNKGYTGLANNCTDINECVQGGSTCHPQAICVNTDGSFDCKCGLGFTGDGFSCENIDECKNGSTQCSPYADCFDTFGSYRCVCKTDYEGDGITCSEPPIKPVEPIEQAGCSFHKEASCDEKATCKDLPDGTFQCICPEGSMGDGLKGVDKKGCQYPSCPVDFDLYGEFCYKMFRTPTKNAEDARLYCAQNMGGRLITLLDDSELSFVRDRMLIAGILTPIWMGYSTNRLAGRFLPDDFLAGSFLPWADGQPGEDPSNLRRCVELRPNSTIGPYLGTNSCTDLRSFGCKTARYTRSCPAGWEPQDNYCYYVDDTPKSHIEASFSCAALGGDLASVLTETENKFIVDKYLTSREGHFWLGLRKMESGQMQFADGTTFNNDSFANWNADRGLDECTAISASGTWTAEPCSSTFGYVCKKKRNAFYRCPIGSEYFEGLCYKLQSIPTDFNSAQAACRAMGGVVATADSSYAQRFLESFLVSVGHGDLKHWIGLREPVNNEKNQFTWITNSDDAYLSFTFWSGLLNNQSGDCVALSSATKTKQMPWIEQACTNSLSYACQFQNTPCLNNSMCNSLAQCEYGQCKCKIGFQGDGVKICEDINECLEIKCMDKAVCNNSVGSYSCDCQKNYVKISQDKCQYELYCDGDADCARNAKCFNSTCSCRPGFVGQAKSACDDVDECATGANDCSVNATCTNLEGSFSCACKQGYEGDGKICKRIPLNCQEIFVSTPGAKNGFFKIDPDGDGPLEAVQVSCRFDTQVGGITEVDHNIDDYILTKKSTDIDILYKISVSHILSLISRSSFCYQTVSYVCQGSVSLLNNGYYVDVNNNPRRSWGGGSQESENKCACGLLGMCRNAGSSCNCDGSFTSSNQVDEGMITDKSRLPVRKLVGGEVDNNSMGKVKISNLFCGPKTFDLSVDCNDLRIKLVAQNVVPYDGPQLLDLDGPNGPLEPYLANCIMKRYYELGVTQIPHNSGTDTRESSPGKKKPATKNGQYDIKYTEPDSLLQALVKKSAFCLQSVRYDCKNSRILGDFGYMRSLSGNKIEYWGSGLGQKNQCACGLVNSCVNKNDACNCDTRDGVSRSDFGLIIEKSDLPISAFILADVTGNMEIQEAAYTLGALECAPKQFGILPSCQYLRQEGVIENYAYLIDPDNTGSVKPFVVKCDQDPSKLIGITIIPVINNAISKIPDNCPNGPNKPCTVKISYDLPTSAQIKSLVGRSTYCYQKVSYACQNSALFTASGSKALSKWVDQSGGTHSYWGGNRSDKQPGCECADTNNCASKRLCNCDALNTSLALDEGYLTNKNNLPVDQLNLAYLGVANEKAEITVGDLVCFEIYRTCSERLRSSVLDVSPSSQSSTGVFPIDPDAVFGLPPFEVTCEYYNTIVDEENRESEKVLDENTPSSTGSEVYCLDIKYQRSVSLEQLRSLAKVSGACVQYASYKCRNTPLTDYVAWYDAWGKKQAGWASNAGGNQCACGEVGRCENNDGVFVQDQSCQCDALTSDVAEDNGIFIDKSQLPVTKICFGLTENTPNNGKRYARADVGAFTCSDSYDSFIPRDCQNLNDRSFHGFPYGQSRAWVVDSDGASGPAAPLTVYCDIQSQLQLGVTVLPNQGDCMASVPASGASINANYGAAKLDQIRALTQHAIYCEQVVNHGCLNAKLTLNDDVHGAVDVNGNLLPYWTTNTGKNGCDGGSCNCDAMDGKNHTDDGKFLDKSVLPITKVILGSVSQSGAARSFCLKELRCYQIFRDCQEIFDMGVTYNRNQHSIDPNGAGGTELFLTRCEFIPKAGLGITWSTLEDNADSKIYSSKNVDNTYNVKYVSASVDQLHELSKISKFCAQRIDYKCSQQSLLNNKASGASYINNADNERVEVWAGADGRSDISQGCACQLLGTCPSSANCRCDERTSVTLQEAGFLTDRQLLPIKSVYLSKLEDVKSIGEINLKPMYCAKQPYGLPEDCDAASKIGFIDGEVLINPKNINTPFLVQCDLKLRNNAAVTIINSNTVDVLVNGTIDVQYKEANYNQILGVVSSQKYCYQPIKFSCYNYELLDGGFTWIGGKTDKEQKGFASGLSQQMCNCGAQKKCSGSSADDATVLRSRKCNCDTGDNENRLDAGIFFSSSNELPLRQLRFGKAAGGLGRVTVGPLFCSSGTFNLNECQLGYHDCHSQADCKDTTSNYDCTCRAGWQGLGTQLVANGRQCFDDDECALNYCPDTATCVNTPGSFNCICLAGFRKTGPKKCEDIDECAENTHNCDKNAKCVNAFGSYICVCSYGYQGSGRMNDCQKMGSCSCFGDPHCRTFDGVWLHYQGACHYTLLRDGCVAGVVSTAPTYEVIQKNWHQNKAISKVAWAKEITFKYKNSTIILKQLNVITVNGQKIMLPSSPKSESGESLDIYISYFGRHVLLRTKFGLVLKWDGKDRIEISLTSAQQRLVCGLCGDYNDNAADDWRIGPNCPKTGQLTTKKDMFGDSWRSSLFESVDRTDSNCDFGCKDTVDNGCSGENLALAQAKCAKLKTLFAKCRSAMLLQGVSFDDYTVGCEFDVCNANRTDMDDVVCSTAVNVATECQESFNITTTWRSSNFCEKKCPDGTVYQSCASPCQPTCNKDAPPCSNTRCTEMCSCPAGKVMENGRCIDPKDCGCFENGLYYSVGYSKLNEECSERCTCKNPGSELTCQPVKCHDAAFCGFENDDYGCHCKNGFMGDGVNCTDVDECTNSTLNNCYDKLSKCNNLVGSYNCTCIDGYEGDGKICNNINECVERKPCNETTEECFDTIGSWQCRCKDGFSRSSTTGKCEDKNECVLNQAACDKLSTNCNNTFGSYNCPCKPGFQFSTPFVCDDIKECVNKSLNNCDPITANCHETVGGFYCTCKQGYTGDGVTCTDIDECKGNPYPCYSDAICINKPGSYICVCADQNMTDCTGPDPCIGKQCLQNHTVCRYGVCICDIGYVLKDGECVDDNECIRGNHNCDAINALCVNSIGSYSCECLTGYVYNPITKVCENINECLEDRYVCDKYAECIDIPGGYICQCKQGFTGHCDECSDIDECQTELNNCHSSLAVCENTIGSFKCSCKTGFIGDGTTCSDVDECKIGLYNCSALSTCVNTIGSYDCACVAGYAKDEHGFCSDDNECLHSSNRCDANAVCINLIGSYRCECEVGFQGDGETCKPDDSVVCGGVKCHSQASCIDSVCTCRDGFAGDGQVCHDVNECIRTDLCDVNADCLNIPGSFICSCRYGFRGDGYACFNQSSEFVCDIAQVCLNGVCTRSPITGEAICQCAAGQILQNNLCVDLNECLDNPCAEKMRCINKLGGYSCVCFKGYREEVMENGKIGCTEIDECAEDSNLCGKFSICKNKDPLIDGEDYRCVCELGYSEIAGKTDECEKVDKSCTRQTACPVGAVCDGDSCRCAAGLKSVGDSESLQCTKESVDCYEGRCDLRASCEEHLPGAKCVCNNGYSGNGIKCDDIDECELGLHNCDPVHGTCRNTPGGFTCECVAGFLKQDDNSCKNNFVCDCGRGGLCLVSGVCHCLDGYRLTDEGNCEDVNECDRSGSCHALAVCTNFVGSYKCSCPQFYNGDGKERCDLNECESQTHNCHEHANCINSLAGYLCECKPGYSGDGRNNCAKNSESCRENNGGCSANSVCREESGSVHCTCKNGFRGDGEVCRDIDECLEGSHNCVAERSMCINSEGSYSCKCRAGYSGTGLNCYDIDECREGTNNCAQNAVCTNRPGGFLCTCPSGFEGDGVYSCNKSRSCISFGGCHPSAACLYRQHQYKCVCLKGYEGDGVNTCEDINECTKSPSPCHENAKCQNKLGGFECKCKDNYEGDGINYCFDVDECTSRNKNNCTNSQVCVNLSPGFKCLCPTGYVQLGDTCVDLNECEGVERSLCDKNADCHNTLGSFYCKCNDGFDGNGRVCSDVDECSGGKANCSQNTLCVNKNGSFDCLCQAGKLKNSSGGCNNVNECDLDNPSGIVNKCHKNADCIDKEVGYKCQCKPGYVGTGYHCASVSPCNKPGICHAKADCTTKPDGSALCTCWDGFQGDGTTNCEKMNPCLSGSDNCDKSTSTCHALEEGYECVCKNGFRKEKGVCKDKNECDPNDPEFVPNPCGSAQKGSVCINTPGSFACSCTPAQVAAGKCSDGNQCASPATFTCDPNASCHDLFRGYECICNKGYQGDGKTCVDRNECVLNEHNCGARAICVNTLGSFKCTCPVGQQLAADGRNCDHVDECTITPEICGDLARCYDTEESYECKCIEGYERVNNTCVDINECSRPTENPCHKDSICTNIPGECTCHCRPGYSGDGRYFCELTDSCSGSERGNCPANTVCHNNATSGKAQCDCASGFQSNGNLHCPGGNVPCRYTEECKDIDECEANTYACHPLARCSNTHGGYECICKDGAKGDGKQCYDIDECAEKTDTCDKASTICVNHPNGEGYSCVCKTGFIKKNDRCVDRNECEDGTNMCVGNAVCENTIGSYTCACDDGYRGNGLSECRDIDECGEKADVCDSENSSCENTDGSYVCNCKNGYEVDTSGKFCKDSNECIKNSTCGSQQVCVNLPGTYLCQCPNGYVSQDVYCDDVNECTTIQPCHVSAICTNTIGSYNCACPSGQRITSSGSCLDINECVDPNACPTGTTCHNDNPGYTCLCPLGYVNPADQPHICVDENECERIGLFACGLNAKCTNTEGSFVCTCADGFKKVGNDCVDINECKVAADNGKPLCAPGKCINTLGAYICDCPVGYKADGGACSKVNECDAQVFPATSKCGENAICHNVPGGFICSCAAGYRKSGDRCVDVNECLWPTACVNGDCFNSVGSFTCVCKPGFRPKGDRCVNVDECAALPDLCGEGGLCLDTPGSYECYCRRGYVLRSGECVQLDICLERAIDCGRNAYCKNLVDDTYTCKCNTGYLKANNGSCININECETGTAQCNGKAICTDTDGSYKCYCQHGYYGDGFTCTPVCKDVCRANEICTVTPSNTAQCSCGCLGRHCSLNNPLCSDERRTFDNELQFTEYVCNSNEKHYIDYFDQCKDSCSDVTCPPQKSCVMEMTGSGELKPTCKCRECTVDENNSGPVCSNLLVTFENRCQFLHHQCFYLSDEYIIANRSCQEVTDCQLSSWSPWSSCSKTCGIGQQTRLRTIAKKASFGGSCEGSLLVNSKCYAGPCKNSPCATKVCKASEWCVEQGATATCQCPQCDNQTYNPICARIGDNTTAITFENLCKFNRYICVHNILDYEFLHERGCSDYVPTVPENCTKIIHFKHLKLPGSRNCTSVDLIAVGECGGGCGKSPNLCCGPSVMSEISVNFQCLDGSSTISKVENVHSCDCAIEKKFNPPV